MNGDQVSVWEKDKLTHEIIKSIIKVHNTLGPGFLESIYRNALLIELHKRGLSVEMEKEVLIHYEGEEVGRHRVDVIAEGRIIVELKVVDELSRAHYAQVRSYLKAAGLRVGILVNFTKKMADYRRIELI